jgi:hypothetical protein
MKAGETAAKVIRHALSLIPDESRWAGSMDAQNEKGNFCSSTNPEAYKFGGYGSLMAACHHFYKESRFRSAAYSSTLDFIEHRVGRKIDINKLDHVSTVRLFEQALGQ